jgi:cytochrome c oxidase cbb3-type subunit 1
MSALPYAAEPADTTPAEAGSRGPLLTLLGFGVLWLVTSAVLSLIAALQLASPAILAGCPWLTVGHTTAMAETAFIYGWIANAGLGLALWMLGRLSAEPLRAANWAVVGTLFWNLAVAGGIIGIAAGEGSGIRFLEIPAHLLPLMLISYAAIGVALVLAWTGRRRDRMFASQWYAVAAIFLFPWIFSIGQVMLVWWPARGALQAILAGWYAQSLWSLWLAPLALSAAYYVVGRMSRAALPAYDTALLGFWTLLFVGGFTGGRHLIDGPVPAWIPTLAIVTSWVLLIQYLIVGLNLRGAFSGGGLPLRFIGAGLFAYLLGGVVDAVTALRAVAVTTQYTYFDQAQLQLALYGAVTLILLGALYFALPRITGAAWRSGALARGHLVVSLTGVALLVICLGIAGCIQGGDLNNPAVTFSALTADVRPWLLGASAGFALLVFGSLLLAINYFQTVAAALLPAARGREAYAS